MRNSRANTRGFTLSGYSGRGGRTRGSILIVAMVVVFALAGLVLALARTARVDAALAANSGATRQADAIERGAEQYVLAMLTNYRDSLDDFAQSDFAQVPVGDGYFWIVRPNYDDDSLPSFGLMDETSKINLNIASYESLRALPGMTDEIAGAIVDWHDPDDTVGTTGAESSSYLAQQDGYRAKNANFESVEELLLVKGMTRDLLYGPPASSNQVITEVYQRDGLADFFTVATMRQPNTAADGTRRININSNPRTPVRDLLASKISATRADQIINSLGPRQITDVFDFANRGGMTYDEFLLVADYLTGATGNTQRGLINVNTAPREVLLTLDPLTESDVDALLARRTSEVLNNPESTAWVYDVLKEKSIGLGNRITGRGRQFSADIVATSRNSRAFKRVRIIVDTSFTTPRIVYRRDITDRGNPIAQGLVEGSSGGTR